MRAIILLLALFLSAQTVQAPELPERPSVRYEVHDCRYYTDGTVITPDGHEWGYWTDTISDREPYDGMPVWVAFDDNGTDWKEDDIILGLVYDRSTAMFDAFEEAFSDVDWKVTREGNNININVEE